MEEDERVKLINEKSAAHLEVWLQQLEDEDVTEDDLIASVYGGMVTAHLLGYNLEKMISDAKIGGDRLLEEFEKSQEFESDERVNDGT